MMKNWYVIWLGFIGFLSVFALYTNVFLPHIRVNSPTFDRSVVSIDYHYFQPARFRAIFPACLDSMAINGKKLKTDFWGSSRPCDYNRKGRIFDLSQWLVPGHNSIEVTYAHSKGNQLKTGSRNTDVLIWNPQILGYNSEFFPGLLLILVCCITLPLAFPCDEDAGRFTKVLLTVAAVLYAVCIDRTTFWDFSNDVHGHVANIQYMARHGWPPPTNWGWQGYQPPLYYFLLSLGVRMARFFSLADPISFVRYLSALFYLTFLYCGLVILKRAIPYRPAYYLTALLLLFWPIGITMAGKINNDIPLTALVTLSLYWLLRWRDDLSPRALAMAIGLAGLATLAKSHGVIMLGLAAFMGMYYLYRGRMGWRYFVQRHILLAVSVAMVCCGINVGRNIYYRYHGASDRHFVIGNVPQNREPEWVKRHRIRTTPETFFIFNPVALIRMPYFSYVDDAQRRNIFWETQAKTLVLGQARWQHRRAAEYAMAALVMMLSFTAAGSALRWRRRAGDNGLNAILAIFAATYLFALMMIQISVPVTGFAHARYVYHWLIVLLAFYGQAIAIFHQEKAMVLSKAGFIIGAVLLGCSFALIYTEYRF